MMAMNDAIMWASSGSFFARTPLALANCRSLNGLPAQRAHGLVGHGDAPVLSEVASPSSSRQDAPSRYRVGCAACRSQLPRERFSPLALFGRADYSAERSGHRGQSGNAYHALDVTRLTLTDSLRPTYSITSMAIASSIASKRKESPYRPGRSPHWPKFENPNARP